MPVAALSSQEMFTFMEPSLYLIEDIDLKLGSSKQKFELEEWFHSLSLI